jgi:hypothetical protein
LVVVIGIPWPTTETGQLKLDDDTFRARSHQAFQRYFAVLEYITSPRGS